MKKYHTRVSLSFNGAVSTRLPPVSILNNRFQALNPFDLFIKPRDPIFEIHVSFQVELINFDKKNVSASISLWHFPTLLRQ